MDIGIHWLQVLVGFVVGVIATLVGQWIWVTFFGKKDYTVTFTEGERTFTSTGEPPKTVNLERLAKSFFKQK
jgi:membrane-associated phospholipid phosphatase